MVPRFHILVRIQALLSKLEYTPEAFCTEYQIEEIRPLNHRHIRSVAKGQWQSLARFELQFLCDFAQRRLEKPFIEAIPHPLWSTFFAKPPIGFVDRDQDIQKVDTTQVARDRAVLNLLTHGRSAMEVGHPIGDDPAAAVQDMSQRNCIFVGGPRMNRYTEFALAALLKIEPYGGTQPDVPFTLLWSDVTQPSGPSSFGLVGSPHRGLIWREAGSLIDLRMQDSPGDTKFGRDLGVCVIVRNPPGTSADVTTIIFAGASAASTKAMAQAFVVDDLPDGLVSREDGELLLTPGQPRFFLHEHQWTRKVRDGRPRSKSRRWLTTAKERKAAEKFTPILF
jgi:hypothetical protein